LAVHAGSRGFIPARLKLQSARRRRLTSEAAETRPDGAQGQSWIKRKSREDRKRYDEPEGLDVEKIAFQPAERRAPKSIAPRMLWQTRQASIEIPNHVTIITGIIIVTSSQLSCLAFNLSVHMKS
jgi:hypothetical protein